MSSQSKAKTASNLLSTLMLLLLGSGIGGIFYRLSRYPNLKSYVPETIALLLAAGLLYCVAAYLIDRRSCAMATDMVASAIV